MAWSIAKAYEEDETQGKEALAYWRRMTQPSRPAKQNQTGKVTLEVVDSLVGPTGVPVAGPHSYRHLRQLLESFNCQAIVYSATKGNEPARLLPTHSLAPEKMTLFFYETPSMAERQ